MTAIVTLTTDYGLRDGYVGALKGAVLAACPGARLVDISHDIPPQDILAAAVAVRTACGAFPSGTVHLVVVDPEVGSDRAGLVVSAGGAWYVAPDSGVLHYPLRAADAAIWRLRRDLRVDRGGTTFDGRDWFGIAAGLLASGHPVQSMGEPTSDVTELSLPEPSYEPYRWLGHVLHIDRFGNLISDLPAPKVDARATARVFVADHPIGPIRASYADVHESGAVATIGALATVEVAVNGGNAAERFRVRRGDKFEILFPSPQDRPAG